LPAAAGDERVGSGVRRGRARVSVDEPSETPHGDLELVQPEVADLGVRSERLDAAPELEGPARNEVAGAAAGGGTLGSHHAGAGRRLRRALRIALHAVAHILRLAAAGESA